MAPITWLQVSQRQIASLQETQGGTELFSAVSKDMLLGLEGGGEPKGKTWLNILNLPTKAWVSEMLFAKENNKQQGSLIASQI